MSYNAIETFIVQALNSRGIKPSYVKGTHMATGSFFIIMPSLKEAYDMMEMIQETTLNGTLNVPEPITIDWSHAQSTLFKTYLGHIPSKYQEWPLPGMSTEATLPPTRSLQQADPDSLRLSTVKQSSSTSRGFARGTASWEVPNLTEQERFMRWQASGSAHKAMAKSIGRNESKDHTDDNRCDDHQHSLFQHPGDHTWRGGKGKSHVEPTTPPFSYGKHCQEQIASYARGRSLPPPPSNPRLHPDRYEGGGGSTSGGSGGSGSNTGVEPAHKFITCSTGVFCQKCGVSGPDFNPCCFI